MVEGNGRDKLQVSRLVRPDGLPVDTEPVTLKLWEVEYPLPTVDPKILMAACMQDVQVQDPISGKIGVIRQLAMPAQVALLLVETVRALELRDEKIETLKERLVELERRFEDPTERDKQEGYDGIE